MALKYILGVLFFAAITIGGGNSLIHVEKRAAYAAGDHHGYAIGFLSGQLVGNSIGWLDGNSSGYADGMKTGYDWGYGEGYRNSPPYVTGYVEGWTAALNRELEFVTASGRFGAVAIVRSPATGTCEAIDTDTGTILGDYPIKDGRCGGEALRQWRIAR